MQDIIMFGRVYGAESSELASSKRFQCPPVSGPRAAGLAKLGVLGSVENPDGPKTLLDTLGGAAGLET